MGTLIILGVDSFSILFNHRSFQKPDLFPPVDGLLKRNEDPWKEWKWKIPLVGETPPFREESFEGLFPQKNKRHGIAVLGGKQMSSTTTRNGGFLFWPEKWSHVVPEIGQRVNGSHVVSDSHNLFVHHSSQRQRCKMVPNVDTVHVHNFRVHCHSETGTCSVTLRGNLIYKTCYTTQRVRWTHGEIQS